MSLLHRTVQPALLAAGDGAVLSAGLGEIRISADQAQQIACFGLGSCIAVVLYDDGAHVGGIAHVVLPQSDGRAIAHPGKWADTAVPELLRQMEQAGARRRNLKARLAGGASVLKGHGFPQLGIGQRNAEATKAALQAAGVAVVAEDTGGQHGRTVWLHIDSGRLLIRTVGHGEKEL